MKIKKPENGDFFEEAEEEEVPFDPFDDRVRVVCFTGHRDIPKEVAPVLSEMLAEMLANLYERGARIFKAGGAVGFDTMAAQAVIDLKKQTGDREIELHLCLAGKNQASSFSRFDEIIFNMILSLADKVTYEGGKTSSGNYLARDRRLVDESDVCVAYCTKQSGGSYYTSTYALIHGVEFINLADFISFE